MMEAQTRSNRNRVTKRAPGKAKTGLDSTAESPSRVFTDVLLAIKSEHLTNIINRQKNHEYRKYRLRDGVERLWLYETAAAGGKASITCVLRGCSRPLLI